MAIDKSITAPTQRIIAAIAVVFMGVQAVNAATFVWDGSDSTDWHTAANWSNNDVPTNTSDVVINGNYAAAPLLDLSGGSVTIKSLSLGATNTSVLTFSYGNPTQKLIITNDCTIGTNGTLTHTGNAGAETHRIYMDVNGDFSIAADGEIDLVGKGYGSRQGPGGTTSGFTGGKHGGEGGNAAYNIGTTYGSMTAPVTMGSGGDYKSGGGAVILNVDGTTTIEGIIKADGTTNPSGLGSGAAGSVFITTTSISGSGSITANGGAASNTGGGGGGRIAIILTAGNSFDNLTIQAYGGPSSTAVKSGAAGTVYTQTQAQSAGQGTLLIDNDGQATSSDNTTFICSSVTGTTVGNVIIQDAGSLELDAGESLTVNGNWANSGTFTAGAGTTVTLGSTNEATISGNNTFEYLSCQAPGKTVNFQASKTNMITAGLTLTGSGSDAIDLNSTSPNMPWYLIVSNGAQQAVSYVAARDSNASGGATIAAADSTNEANNVNWIFGAALVTWTGAADTDWGNTNNWDLTRLPTYLDPVLIPAGGSQPVLDMAREVGALTNQAGANLALAGYDLKINGNANIQGTLTASQAELITVNGNINFSAGALAPANSTILINGNTDQSIAIGTNMVNNLAISNDSATVTFVDSFAAYSLKCIAASAAIRFNAGSVYNITNLYLGGTNSGLITLDSTTNSVQWTLNISGWHSVRYVDVHDSDASGGATVYAADSTNTDNNSGWDFSDWLVWDGSDSTDFGTAANWTPEQAPDGNSMVLIDGNYSNAPTISSTVTVNRVMLDGGTPCVLTINAALTVTGDMLILPGATVTHTANSASETYRVEITASGNLAIADDATIDVTARGYGNRKGPGAQTGAFTGGKHGGEGARADLNLGNTYGSITAPVSMGSGGDYRSGGGAVTLTVTGLVDIAGTIIADGNSNTAGSGAGAGGSVFITAGTIAGTGTIKANGGSVKNAGGGGGGRIAVVLLSGNDFGDIAMQAYGGDVFSGSERGAAGTIYKQTQAEGNGQGTLLIDNNSKATGAAVTTLISSNVTGTTIGNVIIRNAARLELATDQSLTVNGDWTNSATFVAGQGTTVTLATTNEATISGNSTFYYLGCQVPGKTINFLESATTMISHGLALTGSGSGALDLNSTAPGTPWYLTVSNGAQQSVSYVAVRDSDASGGTPVAAANSTNEANNVNWVFGAALITWTGAVDSDWGNTNNWDLARLPTYLDAVLIPAGGSQPVLDMDRSVGVLTNQAGANLSLAGYNLVINGNADIQGTLTASQDELITITGDINFGAGAFAAANSTVLLNGETAQSLTMGTNNVYDLTVSNSSATVAFGDGFAAHSLKCTAASAAIRFNAGSTYNVTNLYLRGTAGGLLTLDSTTNSVQWILNVSGWHSARYIDVRDSDASGGATIYAVDSTNTDNNTGWNFSDWLVWDGSDSTDFDTAANWTPEQAPNGNSMILIDGNYSNAPTISSTTSVKRVMLDCATPCVLTINKPLTVTEDMLILPGATVTHTANGAAETYRIEITVTGNLAIADGAMIDLVGKGHSTRQGPGTHVGSFTGGKHGGEGGNADQNNGITYGSMTSPVNLGSGGDYKPGGGAVILTVNGITDIDGGITANGRGSQTSTGAGAGGSVFITTGGISGSGTITACGGEGSSTGGGGGGRIAIVLSGGTDFGNITMQAHGGDIFSGSDRGAAGTVYRQTPADGAGRGALLIDNNGNAANEATTLVGANVTGTTVGTVAIANAAELTLGSNQVLTVNGDWTNSGTFIAETNSAVILAGTNHVTLSGNTTFHDLTCITGGKTLYFQAGSTNSVEGMLTLDKITLRSTEDDSYWYLEFVNAGETQDVQNVRVQDSNADGGEKIVAYPISTDQGNNVNWEFISLGGTVIMLR